MLMMDIVFATSNMGLVFIVAHDFNLFRVLADKTITVTSSSHINTILLLRSNSIDCTGWGFLKRKIITLYVNVQSVQLYVQLLISAINSSVLASAYWPTQLSCSTCRIVDHIQDCMRNFQFNIPEQSTSEEN